MITDYIAGILELTGSYSVGNKKKYGFLFKVVSNAIWVYVAAVTELYGLLAVGIIAMIFNIRNYLKWRKGEIPRWQRNALTHLLNL